MDQGVAALLGALVGSLATGGAALVTSAGAARLQTRKERRDGCLAVMTEALAVLHLSEDLMVHSTAARRESRTPDYAQFITQALETRRRVEKCCDVLVLAGPQKIKGACDALTEAAVEVHTATRHADERRLALAVAKLMHGMDTLRQRGSRL